MNQNFGKILDRSKNSVNYKSRPIIDKSGSLRQELVSSLILDTAL